MEKQQNELKFMKFDEFMDIDGKWYKSSVIACTHGTYDKRRIARISDKKGIYEYFAYFDEREGELIILRKMK